MANKKTHIDLLQTHPAEIDAPVGEGGDFLPEAAGREVRRRRLMEILKREAPAWDPADHPDIEKAGGAAAWVSKLRGESDRASMRRIRSKRG
jgi:hypothetical protein